MKTRLIPALGSERASRLHAAMARKTLLAARHFCAQASGDLDIYFTGGDAALMLSAFGQGRYLPQTGDHLGDRLRNACAAAFFEGAAPVVVIGTDCPDLTPHILTEAFEALKHFDVVLGPAIDGGYYLLGLREPQPELFHNVDWGTACVLRQTLDHARRLHLQVRQLTPLADIDTPEDLIHCRSRQPDFEQVLPLVRPGIISVVIPTLNEERVIGRTLQRFEGLENVEVIVADGGSTDGTQETVRHMGITVVPVSAGRGRQLNAGAALASGEALLFLHADTQLPDGFQQVVWSTLESGAIAGAFRLSIDEAGLGLRLIEWGANLRSRAFQRPYGDQALFLRAETFFALGGFPNWRLMEDYEFCCRLRAKGRIRIANAAVRTSVRRWRKLGLWKTTVLNQLCVAGFHLGIPPDTLGQLYRR